MNIVVQGMCGVICQASVRLSPAARTVALGSHSFLHGAVRKHACKSHREASQVVNNVSVVEVV